MNVWNLGITTYIDPQNCVRIFIYMYIYIYNVTSPALYIYLLLLIVKVYIYLVECFAQTSYYFMSCIYNVCMCMQHIFMYMHKCVIF